MSGIELNTSSEHIERTTLFADVLLPVPIKNFFTYRVPFELNEHIDIGYRAIVQFGKKKILTGIVVKLHEKPPTVYQAKYILDLLDDRPMMLAQQLQLYEWIAEYYMATIGEVYNVGMPSGLKLSSESKIQLNPEFDLHHPTAVFSEKEKRIIDVLERDQVITYGEAARILEVKSYLRIIKSLIAKEAILIFEEVREKYAGRCAGLSADGACL